MESVNQQPADNQTLFDVPTGTEHYTLIEKLEGPAGTAYRWADRELDGPMSRDRWLISLPDHDSRTIDDAENPETGVFVLNATLSGHEFWAQFRGVLPRFGYAYQLHLCEAHEPAADASDPESAYDVSDPLLGDYGNDLELLPHLMRAWAEDLVAGVLSPYGPVETPAEAQNRVATYFASLTARADAARQGA
ncbi:hypothetical protein ACMT4L_16905 [Deinococcus sp. A31D244]|uniref:hypothetical protein n=1 Tax=Deinococcus sp. A31D244 TaxID=3397675 RepID=UPI0039E065C7